jgi:hypothetical protein
VNLIDKNKIMTKQKIDKKVVGKPELYTVLPTALDDQTYINELEGIVCFLAQTYQQLKETYFTSHMKTCDITNPNRRDLTENEHKEWQKFTLIQGGKLQNIVKHFAETNKPRPNDIDKALTRFKEL